MPRDQSPAARRTAPCHPWWRGRSHTVMGTIDYWLKDPRTIVARELLARYNPLGHSRYGLVMRPANKSRNATHRSGLDSLTHDDSHAGEGVRRARRRLG